MNDVAEFEIPMLLDDASVCQFFDKNYDTWYRRFVQHWSTHHITHPCNTKDGKMNQ
jgi:hypothetical protein